MLVYGGPQGRLVIPNESPSKNKVLTYLLTYLLYLVAQFFSVIAIFLGKNGHFLKKINNDVTQDDLSVT